MDIEKILVECMERKKLNPAKTASQIVGEVMDEIASYKTELRKRREFALPE